MMGATAFAQQESTPTTLSCRSVEMALENNIENNIAKEQITAADYRVTPTEQTTYQNYQRRERISIAMLNLGER